MVRIKKGLSLILIVIFLCQNVVFCLPEKDTTLRPALQTNSLSNEINNFLTEQEEGKISPIIEQIMSDIESTETLPYVTGVAGRAGTTKTEFLSPLIKRALEKRGKKVLIVGLDEFFKTPEERESLGEWNEKHIRLQDAAGFMDKVKRGKKSISKLKYVRTPEGNMLIPDTVNLEGIDVVIFDGLYVISSEERLGNLLRFIDLPIYMEAKEEDLKKWRFLQETKKPHPRSLKEMEKHWLEGIVSDSATNIIPSRANAEFIVHIGSDHNISKIEPLASMETVGKILKPQEGILKLIAKIKEATMVHKEDKYHSIVVIFDSSDSIERSEFIDILKQNLKIPNWPIVKISDYDSRWSSNHILIEHSDNAIGTYYHEYFKKPQKTVIAVYLSDTDELPKLEDRIIQHADIIIDNRRGIEGVSLSLVQMAELMKQLVLTQKGDRLKDAADEIAKVNKWNEIWSFELQNPKVEGHSSLAQQLVKEKKIKDGQEILSLGAGYGKDEMYFIENIDCKVIATDFSQVAVDNIAKQRNLEFKGELKAKKQDITKQFDFSDNSFDVVYAHQSLMYFFDEEMIFIIGEIYRVLKPGGKAIISVRSINDWKYADNPEAKNNFATGEDGITRRFFDKRSLRELFERSNFVGIIIEENIIDRYKNEPPATVLYMFASKMGNMLHYNKLRNQI